MLLEQKINGKKRRFKLKPRKYKINLIEKNLCKYTNIESASAIKVEKLKIWMVPFYLEKQQCTGCEKKCRLGAFAKPVIKQNHIIVYIYPVIANKIYEFYYDNYFCKIKNTRKEITLINVRALKNLQQFKTRAWVPDCLVYETLSDAEIISWHCKKNKSR